MKAVVILMVVAGAAHADERVGIKLGDALAAVAKAPGAAVPAAELQAAEASVAAAGGWLGPALRVGTSRLTAKLAVGTVVGLPVFGTVGAARTRAAAAATVTRAEGELALRQLRHRVVHAWVELARADGFVVASSIAAQHAAELELIAKGRTAAGVGADVDLTVAGAARARADVEVAAAQRLLDAASAELAGLLGWDPARPLRADGGLVTGDATSLEALRAHLGHHPERVLAQHRVYAAQTSVREVLAERWPHAALEAELLYDDRSVTEGATPWARTDVTVALAIEVPLFAHVGDRARAARATESAERARLAVAEAQLGAELFAAYRRWQAASERLQAMERDVAPAQERAAALAAQAFREGARDLAYALQASRDLAATRADVNAARADAAAAFADLQLAAGVDAR